MKWYGIYIDKNKKEIEIEIPEHHTFDSWNCETFGQCAIKYAEETLHMVLELTLEGHTTARINSRAGGGSRAFWHHVDGAVCGWWGAEKEVKW